MNFHENGIHQYDVEENCRAEEAKDAGAMPSYQQLYDTLYRENSSLAPSEELDSTRDATLTIEFKHLVPSTIGPSMPGLNVSVVIDTDAEYYTQGDEIKGRVIVENTTSTDIRFDMFYITFQGKINTNKISKTFLEVLHTLTDLEGLHNWIAKDYLQPNSTYQTEFSFRIPTTVLDSTCCQSLPTHINLPPTFNTGLTGVNKGFRGTSIDYGIYASITGNTDGKIFVLLGDKCPIPIIPITTQRNDIPFQHSLMKGFTQLIQDKIRLATDLNSVLQGSNHDDIEELIESLEQAQIRNLGDKSSQLYHAPAYQLNPLDSTLYLSSFPENWNFTIEKGLLKKRKINVSTPKHRYQINCCPDMEQKISIPIEVDTPSDIMVVRGRLVFLSLQSQETAFPVEFNHDMFIKNTTWQRDEQLDDTDTFRHHITEKFKQLYDDLRSEITTFGKDRVKVNKQLLEGLVSLATCQDQVTEFPLSNITIEAENKVKFNVIIDFSSLKHKRTSKLFGDIRLVPEFQTCHLARFYYIKLLLEVLGSTVFIKLPLSIVN